MSTSMLKHTNYWSSDRSIQIRDTTADLQSQSYTGYGKPELIFHNELRKECEQCVANTTFDSVECHVQKCEMCNCA